MTHDPLCPNSKGSCCPWMGDCDCQCRCELITQVRADERSRWLSPYFSEEYHRGYRQAEADFRKSSEPNNT